MLSPTQSTLRKLAHETRGAEIAEAAVVLPLMFMILLGIFWFGQAFSIYGAITRAAQEGARAGAAPYCTTCSGTNTIAQYEANAVDAVQNALIASHMNPAQTQRPTPSPTLKSCIDGSAKPCSGTSTNMCVQTNIQITSTTGGATGVCGVSVTFQYPFQFWLPFTSLSKQKIWIKASSQVRMETQ